MSILFDHPSRSTSKCLYMYIVEERSDRVYAHPNDTTVADAQFRKISNSAQGGRFALIL